MTEHEIWELKEKQQVLRLAQERMAIDDGYDGYMIHEDYLTDQGCLDKKIKPDASKKLYEKSKRPAEAFVTDVDRYEEIQTPNGPTKLGTMDRQDQVAYYELLLDESATIALLTDQDSRIGVTLSSKGVALMAPFDAAEHQAKLIAAGRKSLPLNDWTDQFLQGVAEMLVLIVVGETGAGQTTQL
ncbi:hypothetical protein O181_098990, partial [Austropuccinia psidii MF-1]|nr:hypothetical protein [Austropuccinia psidii MF-1]